MLRLQVIHRSATSPPTPVGTIILPGGRRLAYAEAGSSRGFPVLYLHGAIGSPRWRSPALDAAIAALGIRFVVPDRPGFGSSDPSPGRRVADFANDVGHLADALALERFSVVGVSAGAPYALACARFLGERVAATVVVSPFAPPAAVRRGHTLGARYRLPLATFAAPGAGPAMASVVLRALGLRSATSPRAMIDDYAICCRGWGFAPGEIEAPVRLWHARHDRLVPVPHARRLQAALPAGDLALEPRGGHFFFRSRVADILGHAVDPVASRSTDRLAPA